MNTDLINNPSFQSYNDVKSIAQAFSQQVGLHYFGFCRIYPNGHFLNLANRHQWSEDYFLEQRNPPATATNYDAAQSGIYLPALDQDSEFGWVDGTIVSIKEKYGLYDPLLIIRKHENFNEVILFSLVNVNAHSFYMNHLDIFEDFIFYFKDRARSLIDLASKNLVQLGKQTLKTVHNSRQLTSNRFQPRKYYLIHNNTEISVSAKEYVCLSQVSHGRQIKSIAQDLKLSPRTIETYLERIKRKLNLHNREQLASVFWKNRIIL